MCESELISCSVVSNSLHTMDYSLLGSSVHGILQARILEWIASSFSRRVSQLRNWTLISCIGRQILYTKLPGKSHKAEQTYAIVIFAEFE